MKIDRYCQRRKCIAENLLRKDIRLMPIFVGFAGASRKKIAIFASWGRYFFRNFIHETKIIISEYAVPEWLFIVIKTDDLV